MNLKMNKEQDIYLKEMSKTKKRTDLNIKYLDLVDEPKIHYSDKVLDSINTKLNELSDIIQTYIKK